MRDERFADHLMGEGEVVTASGPVDEAQTGCPVVQEEVDVLIGQHRDHRRAAGDATRQIGRVKVTARVLGLWQGNGLVTERLACRLPPATLENADSHYEYLVLTGAPTF